MDPEKVDEITADSIEVGDLIMLGGTVRIVDAVTDTGESIKVWADGEPDPVPLDPDSKVDLYIYPSVTVD